MTTSDDIGKTATALRHAASRLHRRLRQSGAETSQSLGKLSLLGLLQRSAAPMTIGDLARIERLQPQTLTRIVAELEADGLIDRGVDPEDRRQLPIAISDAGRNLLVQYARQQSAWLADAMRDFNETELGVIALAAPLLERLAESVGGFTSP